MNTTREINVTLDMIKHGKPARTCNCPISLAVAEKVKPNLKVSILSEDCAIYEDGWKHEVALVKLPIKVGNFVLRFDTGMAVEPFTFTLELPEELWRYE